MPCRSTRGRGGAAPAQAAGQQAQQQQQQKQPALSLPDLESLKNDGMRVLANYTKPSSAATACGSVSSSSGGACGKVLWVVHADGRACIVCQCKDSDPDRVFVGEVTMKWAYPPCATTKKNNGFVCYYCQRVWQARFKGKYTSLEAFVQACGQDMQLFQVFNHWLSMAVDLMRQNKSHDIKIKWGDESSVRKLVMKTAAETRLCEPEDEIIPLEDYIKEHGDYRYNGLGHRYIDWGSVKGVLIPGKRVWKVKRAKVMKAEIQEEVDAGDFQLGPLQLESLMEDMGSAFIQERATGMSLDSLLGSSRHLPPPPAPALASAASSSAAPTPSSFSMFTSWPGMQSTTQNHVSLAVPVPGGGMPSPAAKVRRCVASPQQPSASSGAGDPKSRGRPKDDIKAKCNKLFVDFGVAPESSARFFGAERKPHIKQITRLVADLGSALNTVEGDADETQALNLMLKKTNAVLSLCRAYHAQKDFSKAFEEVEIFAKMAPVVEDVPCPVWMHHLRYSHVVEKAVKPGEFWSLLAHLEMKKAKIEDKDFEAKQVEMICNKFLLILRIDDHSAQATLISWSDPEHIKRANVTVAVGENVDHVRTIATYDNNQIGPDVLDTSVVFCKCVANKIAHVLMAVPVGRKLIESAGQHAARLRSATKAARFAVAIVEGLDAAFDASIGKVDWEKLVQAWNYADAKLDAEVSDKGDVAEKVP